MRKNTKAILVFLCALVMVLTGIGMPVAKAATVLDGLTVDSIFDSLGESLQYGVVAHRWEQANHAETSACVDELYKMTDTVFSNSDITYSYALDYSLTVDVTAPQNKTLQGMSFALFTYNGGEYVRCDENVAPVQKVETAVSSTTLEWKIGGDLRNERLYVFQLDQDGTGYVENGSKNSANLVVTYGPSISASAQNEIYLGKVIFPGEKGMNVALGIFNTPYTHSPCLTLGGGVQLYSRGKDDSGNDIMVPLENVENLSEDLSLEEVFVDYFYEKNGQLVKAQMKLDAVQIKNGKFMIGDSEIDVKLDNRGENHVADTLLKDASEFSYIVGNMGGGEISDKSIPPKGPSTVTGPVGADGSFVSIYDVEVGADGKFIVKDDMGWLNDSRVDDNSKVGIPIQKNEYVIINLICPSNDPDEVVELSPGASDVTYFVEEGQTKGEIVGWAEGGNTDSGASQRVIFNFVYVDENGIMQPYQGKVIPNNGHGGTLLVPEGRVEVTSNVHNGGIIANEVYNAGQEIHQRTMAAQGRSTWVRMDCGTIWLQKASVGYNWNTKPYGKWEDMSSETDLSGAVFGVYSNKNCTEDSLVMTMTTDETGKATSDLLSAGTYWVKEITPLKDHNLSTDVVEVKVVAGEKQKVQGPGYKVRPSNGQPGYEVVKPGAFANQQNNGYTTLRLVKNDEFGNVLPGAEFGIYKTRHIGMGGNVTYSDLIATAKSNRYGVVLFENVPLSYEEVTYYIREITPPEGYHRNDSVIEVELNKEDHRDKIVTIDGNGNAAGEAFVNEIIRGRMALKKQDAVTNMPLPGAEFTIYSDAARTKEAGKMTTGFLPYDTTGYFYGAVAVERDLIPGTYYVVETKAPDGYELPYEMVNGQKVDKVYTVEVLPGEMVDVVTGNVLVGQGWNPAESYATPIGNTQVVTIKGQKIWHDDGDTTNRPQQVTIELYKKVTGSTEENFVARTQISGPDWKFEFKTDFNNVKLPRYDEKGKEIEYIVKEGRTGLEYYYSFVKQTKDNNGNITATVANTIKTTVVTGHKVWEDKLEVEKHPERITFLLFAEMEGELVPINYSYGGQMNVTGYRHEGYKFTFNGLPTYDVNGESVTYVVKEAESDDYYLLDSDSTSTTVNNTITVDFTLTNRLTVPLKGTKTWDDGGRTDRPDVELEIKQNGKDFPLTGRGALDGVEIIWDKETNPDVWTWKVVGLPKYDDAGNPYTYTVTEKRMPGYKSEVTTDENGIHFTNTLDGTGRIRLYKENEAGERLDGVEFGLYTDPNCTPESRVGGVYKTEYKAGSNEHGKLEIKDIPYGTYYLKEETTPEGYVENTKIYKVEVYKPGTEPSDIVNGDREHPQIPGNMNVVVNKKVGETTSATLDLTKTVEVDGNAIVNETFNFAMTFKSAKDAAGTDKTTGYTIDDGVEAIAFTAADEKTAKDAFKVSFTEAGEYTFEVKETAGQNSLTTYDDTVYTVVYTVTEANGALHAKAAIESNEGSVAAVVFQNRVKAEEKTSVTITKSWVNADFASADEVPNIADKLTLCKLVNGKPVPVNNAPTPTYVATDNDRGQYTWFGLPMYDENGNEIEYVVVEQAMPGYEQAYFDKDGKYIDDTYAPNGGAIDNKKVEEETTAVIITKKWVGGPLADSDISKNLVLNADGIDQTAKPTKKDNVYAWYDLPVYDADGEQIVYTVEERDVPNGYIVSYEPLYIGEDADQEVAKGFAFTDETITNTYYESEGEFVLKASKELEGRKLEAGEFIFVLEDWNGDVLQTVRNDGDGNVVFEPLKFTDADVGYGMAALHTYYIYELDGDLPGVSYDSTKYTIKLELADDKAGNIVVTPIGEDLPQIVFTNTYEEKAYEAKGTIVLEGTKTLEGRALKEGEFSFELKDAKGAVLQTKTNDKDGNIVFDAIEYTEADLKNSPIKYTISEVKGSESGMTYATNVVEVTVTLTDNGDGTINAKADLTNEQIKFVNTYEEKVYEAKGSIVLEGTKTLEGRALKEGEFSFELKDAKGAVLQTKTNDKDGNIVFDAIEYTEADLKNSPIKYTISEVKGSESGMTYATNVVEVTVTLTDNGDGTINAKADLTNEQIKFVNTYEEKVYEAKGSIVLEGTKTLEGRALKEGEFSFEVKDTSDKVVATGTNKADGKITFSEIKYTEKDAGKTYTYKVYEVKGNLPGVTYVAEPVTVKVTVTDNGNGTLTAALTKDSPAISFTNTYEAEGSVTFKGAKFLLGREFKQGDEFTFELLNEKGDVIDTVTINPVSGTKADFAFKTIKYELDDAGKTYTYTYRVKEKAGAEDGMTYDDTVHTVTVTVSDAGDGSLKVVASNNANALNFTNAYLAEGSVLFSGTKTMNGKALVGKDFTFVLTDADGKEIETVTNDKDGKIVFSTIQYDLEDAGKTFTYKVSEKNDGKKAVTYDDTVYTVTVKVEDAGNGRLKVTASDNATKLNFTNSYEAKAYLTLNAYKTVNGYKPTADQVYDFVLLCDDGTEMKAQNKAEEIIFGTIGFDEDDIGKTFIYTVKETTEANELLEVDPAIYQVAVTVVDNGDGNLKLETEFLKDGKRANGVVFANTATATLAISKTVKGPGPDKAFDLKVTFIGVDGKELEGVYDYDGDVKGTITSGGVIALKDGQSVTIVGLPEGATYTVEENAGPAYTVTVNGKPIAKAEGTLVGHGKLEFINTVETTTFSVTKVWEGTDLGAITLTLYADGKQITPQPEVTREGDKYTYYNLPKYNEAGEEIVYSAKERGIDGYIRIYNNVEPYQNVTSVVHNGGTIVNREVEEEVHELSFKIRKVWTGVEATEEIPTITLTLYCNGEKLDVPTPKPNSEGWYRYYDLPKTVNGQIAVYTVIEEPIPGYTVTYKTASGEVVEEGVNGGEIINAKIPQTGDPATLGLWLALMGASAVLLTMLQRRRKA